MEMMTFGDVAAMACWCEGGGVVYSGPRLAGAVFSWGREAQRQVEVMRADDNTGSAQGGCGDGPRQREQRAAG